MAELVTSLLSPIMEELGKTLLGLVKRQLNYLCCFDSNIESLREEAESLKNERDDLQRRVDAVIRNTDDKSSVVNAWIEDSNKIQDYTNGIEDELKNPKSGCLAIKSRFLLSKKARDTADAIKIHREIKSKFKPEDITVPALPPSMIQIPQGPSESGEFASRRKIENKIMEDLRDRKVHMMGICGMGGVGKTTMAERIMSTVREEKLFEEVVKIVISQEIVNSPEVRKLQIQREIAEKFGLKLEEESLSARADKLHKRLMDATRKLLILDDIWEELDLKSLGIPCKSDEGEGCTILLTSRSREVLSDMNAKPFGVQILTPEEALSLFRGKIGTCADADDEGLLRMSEEVVAECKGLPLALATMGAALKDKSIEHWRVALRQLRSPNSQLPKVLKEVYKPIKVSYDFLDNPDARSLFLFCCLFPEDANIPLEYLTMCGMGLRMFTDQITTLEEARDTVRVLVDTLKSCFLLLESNYRSCVKMHDVVRDAAIYIASKERHIVRNLSSIASGREESINCKWISVVGEETNKLPIWPSFPSLRLLMIHNYSGKIESNTGSSFLKGMIELNVLTFGGISFRSLPKTTQLLKNLQTLYLVGCPSLKNISIVGELSSLEILICRRCSRIAKLPVEIGRLKKLRMLEVYKCVNFNRIAPDVISNLVRLEELIIVHSFNEWEMKANGEQRKNAALCEIEHLENLTRLEIDIENSNLTAEEIRLPSKIVKFAVTVGGYEYSFDNLPYERKMQLRSEGNSTFGKWIHVLLTGTEYLDAKGANNLDISQAQKIMKRLRLEDCSNVNKLVNITASMDRIGAFPLLESLQLSDLPNLEDICVGSIPKSSNSFGNLKELHLVELPALEQLWKSPHQNVSLCNLTSIHVEECSKLKKLFSLLIAKDGLLRLKTLEINKCRRMEQVFDEMDREECQKITFPKLKSLNLSSLSSLISFYEGSATIEFPLLKTIFIEECRKLKSISSTGDNQNLAKDDDSFHVFFNQKVIFGNLIEISISWCDDIRILFSSSTVENLVKLENLSIVDCKEMIKVIEDDEDVSCDKPRILFPCLKKLELRNLFKLESFCNWKCDLQLPSLEEVDIYGCPLLAFFTMGAGNAVKELHFNAELEEDINGEGIHLVRNRLRLKRKGAKRMIKVEEIIEEIDET